MFEKVQIYWKKLNKLRKKEKLGGLGGVWRNFRKYYRSRANLGDFRAKKNYGAKIEPKNCQRAKSVTKNLSDP